MNYLHFKTSNTLAHILGSATSITSPRRSIAVSGTHYRTAPDQQGNTGADYAWTFPPRQIYRDR